MIYNDNQWDHKIIIELQIGLEIALFAMHIPLIKTSNTHTYIQGI